MSSATHKLALLLFCPHGTHAWSVRIGHKQVYFDFATGLFRSNNPIFFAKIKCFFPRNDGLRRRFSQCAKRAVRPRRRKGHTDNPAKAFEVRQNIEKIPPAPAPPIYNVQTREKTTKNKKKSRQNIEKIAKTFLARNRFSRFVFFFVLTL